MYDEREEKAAYAATTVSDETPLVRAMTSLHQSIEVAASISEKLGVSLQTLLRESVPKEDNAVKMEAVDMSSAHVRDVMKAQRHVTDIADRLRSLLERVEV